MMREGAADRETLFKSSLVLFKRGLVTLRTARILGGSDSAGGWFAVDCSRMKVNES